VGTIPALTLRNSGLPGLVVAGGCGSGWAT